MSRCVDDQHARNLKVVFLELLKHKHLNQSITNTTEPRCYSTCVSSYVFNHPCLFHNRLFWNVCGSDLLCDPSSFAILNMSVSQLHTPKQKNDNSIICVPMFVIVYNERSQQDKLGIQKKLTKILLKYKISITRERTISSNWSLYVTLSKILVFPVST